MPRPHRARPASPAILPILGNGWLLFMALTLVAADQLGDRSVVADIGHDVAGRFSLLGALVWVALSGALGLALVSRLSRPALLPAVCTAISAVLLFAADVISSRRRGSLEFGAVEWPGSWIVAGALVALGAAVALVARRFAGPAALGTATATGAIFVGLAATFDDNSPEPTDLRWSLPVFALSLAPLVARRHPGVSLGVFAIQVLALPWILVDAAACHDDDCVPVPLFAGLMLVAAIWAGLGVVSGRRDIADRREPAPPRPRATTAG